MAHFQEQSLEAEKPLLVPKDSAEELLKARQNNRGLQKQTKNRWFALRVRKLAKNETHCLKTEETSQSILRHEPQSKTSDLYKMAYDMRKEERPTSFH